MKAAVIYWSGTGNTELMAQYISSGIDAAGAQADVMTVVEAGGADLDSYDYLVFGCPAMGAEVLEETEFEPFFAEAEISLSGKNVALFGSYGWGDGQWMRDWQERVTAAGGVMKCEGLIECGEPDADRCTEFGKEIVS